MELVCLNQFHDIIPGSSINPSTSSRRSSTPKSAASASRYATRPSPPSAQMDADAAGQPDRLRPQRPGLPAWRVDASSGFRPQRRPWRCSPRRTAPDRRRRTAALQRHAACWLRRARATDRAARLARPARKRPAARRAQRRRRHHASTTRQPARTAAARRTRQPVPGFRGSPAQLGRLGCGHLLRRQDVDGEPGAERQGRRARRRATLEIRRRGCTATMCSASRWRTTARLDFDTTIDWRERHIMLKSPSRWMLTRPPPTRSSGATPSGPRTAIPVGTGRARNVRQSGWT